MKITFKKNYNSKLESDLYLAILPFKSEYTEGEEFDIFVATKQHHRATIIYTQVLSLNELQTWHTQLDVGLSADQYRDILLQHLPDKDPASIILILAIFQKKPEAVNEKIALFCRHYEAFAGVKYKVSKAEIGMLKKTEITEDLAAKFFACTEFWAKVKSVSYYCKNVNEIKRLQHQKTASSHPNFWDKDYFSRLPSEKVTEYYRHLRSLGLKSRKNSLGDIIAWEKE